MILYITIYVYCSELLLLLLEVICSFFFYWIYSSELNTIKGFLNFNFDFCRVAFVTTSPTMKFYHSNNSFCQNPMLPSNHSKWINKVLRRLQFNFCSKTCCIDRFFSKEVTRRSLFSVVCAEPSSESVTDA